MIELFAPGIQYYADKVRSGKRWHFVRYGEGEWKIIVPVLSLKGRRGRVFWGREAAAKMFRHPVCVPHQHESYQVAAFHVGHLEQWPAFNEWVEENVPRWVVWHDGHVWKDAVEADEFGLFCQALRDQGRPIIFVGPERLERVAEFVPVIRHIITDPRMVYRQFETITEQVQSCGDSLFLFSAGGVGKVLIHRLWSVLQDSIMLDMGAVWEGLCGHPLRPYQRNLTPERIRRNVWGL